MRTSRILRDQRWTAIAAGAGLAGLVIVAGLADTVRNPALADEAHAIAQKFADEIAAEDRALAAKKQAAIEAREKAVKRAAESRRQAEDARRANAQQKLDEAEMLASARAEQAERDAEVVRAQKQFEAVELERLAAEAKRQAGAKQQAEAAEAQRAAEAAEAKRTARAAEIAAAAGAEQSQTRDLEAQAAEREREGRELVAQAAEREREGRELVAKLNAMRERVAQARASQAAREQLAREQLVRAQASREQAESGTATREAVAMLPSRLPEPRTPATDAAGRPSPNPEASSPGSSNPEVRSFETRATILLVMQKGTRGVRFDNVADPVLCIRDTCFIGAGVNRPAVRLTRANALGPINTVMYKAGACNRRLACVFRAIDFNWERIAIQPVDLRVFGHDRRDAVETGLDASCRVEAGRLACSHTLEGSGWRAWVVPESVAAAAGPGVLEAALTGGLAR